MSVSLVTGLNSPAALAADSISLYISDSGNNRVIKVPTAGGAPITLVSGLNNPTGVAVDGANVYVSDSGNNRVLKVPLAGGTPSPLGLPNLNNPAGVAVDSGGNLYVSDSGNNRVIKAPVAGGTLSILLSSLNKPRQIGSSGRRLADEGRLTPLIERLVPTGRGVLHPLLHEQRL